MSLCLLGNVTLDFPLPWLPSGSLARRLALPRAPQVHQLLRESVRLHAAAVHAVPRGLRAVQDPLTPRQDQVLQIHLGWGSKDEVEENRDFERKARRGRSHGSGFGPFLEDSDGLWSILNSTEAGRNHCQHICLFSGRHSAFRLLPSHSVINPLRCYLHLLMAC